MNKTLIIGVIAALIVLAVWASLAIRRMLWLKNLKVGDLVTVAGENGSVIGYITKVDSTWAMVFVTGRRFSYSALFPKSKIYEPIDLN